MARPRWMKLQLAMRASIGGRGRAEAAAGRMSVVTKSPEQEGTGVEPAVKVPAAEALATARKRAAETVVSK